MTSTVVPGLSTSSLKPTLRFFGFFFVPALVGEAVTVSVASESLGSAATAMPAVATASVAVAAIATVSSLRKGCSPPRQD
jgi:hypothetical protein